MIMKESALKKLPILKYDCNQKKRTSELMQSYQYNIQKRLGSMRFKEKMFQLATQFQNLKLNGPLIQFTYFLIHFVFKVPIMCGFGVVQSKLIRNSNWKFIFIERSDHGANGNINISHAVLIFYSIILVGMIYLILEKRNQQEGRVVFFSILIVQSLNELGSFYLIQLCITNQMAILSVFSILILLLSQGLMVIMDKYWISYEGDKGNGFSHKYSGVMMILKVLQRMGYYVIITLNMMGREEGFGRNIFYYWLTVIYAIKTYLNLTQKYYINNLSHLLQTTGNSFCLILLSVIDIYQISQQPLLKQNFSSLCIIMGIFSFLSIYSFNKYMTNQYLFMPLDQITSRELIIPYLTAFHYLWINRYSTINSYFIASFRKNHTISCTDPYCICRNSLKHQDSNILFIENYLKNTFKYLFSYTKDPNVILQILFLRLEMFHQIFSVNQKLKQIKLQSRFNDISTQAGVYILSKKLQKLISERNSQNGSIDVIAVLNLEQKINSIQRIIIQDIKIKRHKWKYLCQSICKSTDIEQDIVQQISNIIGFEKLYHENKVNYGKNLAFNCLSLFYYGSIVFFKKEIGTIQKNIRQIINPIRQNFISYQKQLQHNIFNHNCCLLQFDIHLNSQNQQSFQLIISNCNKNTKNVFGYDKSKIIGSQISNIFPQFLSSHMKSLLNDYFESKTFNNQVQNFYFLDNNSHVFQGLTCIKIVPKNDVIECVFFIYKKDSDNIILLNKKGLIENISKNFTIFFGNDYQKIPFSSFFYSPQEFSAIKFVQSQQKRKICLIDGKSMKQGWAIYLQNVIKYCEKEDFKSMNNITLGATAPNLPNLVTNKNSMKRFYDFLRTERKQLFSIKKRAISMASINNKQTKQAKSSKTTLMLLDANMRYKMCSFQQIVFYKVVLERVEKKNYLQSQYNQSTKAKIKQPNQTPLRIDNPFNIEQMSYQDKIQNQDQASFYDFFNEDENTDCITIQSAEKLERSDSDFIVQKNSINSSLKTEDLVSFNNRFIQICFKLFKNPDEIRDTRLKFFTANSFICSALFVALLCSSFIIFRLSLVEVKDIFFADGAVSDNMQLTEFMYNRALNFKLHQDNKTYIEMIRKSADFERQYLYNLMVLDQHSLLTVVTSMTKTRFYEYIKVPVKWLNSKQENDFVEIESNQFLLFFKLLSMQVDTGVENGSPQALSQVDDYLRLMKMNFPELKRINHGNLYLYKQMSDKSLALTESLFMFLSVGHLILSIGAFLVFYREKMFRRMQQIEGYSIYKIIPPKIIDILSNYYNKYAEENKTDADLIKYQNYFDSYGLVLGQDNKGSLKPNKSVFLTNSKSPLAAYKMFFILIIMNVFYVISIFKISDLVQPIKSMMNNVNDLMDSQNYLLQAYFDLKANFLIDNPTQFSPQFFDQILESQKSGEVIFNKISIQSLTLFTNYDPSFSSDFIYLLINDSCDIAKGQLTDVEYDKCKTFFKLKFLQNGVTMAMNFFTRKVKETIIEVKNLVANQLKDGMQSQDIRRQMVERFRTEQDFKEIDESIFYMFKLYQATQSKIYASLETTIILTMDVCLVLVIIEIAVIGILYPLSLAVNYRQEKFELSKLYVSFLLIPTPVSQFIKSFSQKIQQILQYN